MLYKVFTDGAFHSGNPVIGLAYVVVTEDRFLRMKQYHSNGTSPLKAEIIALGLAISYLLKDIDLQKDDEIELNTDSKAAIEYFETGSSGLMPEGTQDKRLLGALHNYRLLCEKAMVQFNKNWAHETRQLSGNKLADRLAKYAISKV